VPQECFAINCDREEGTPLQLDIKIIELIGTDLSDPHRGHQQAGSFGA
jgi:hypothetical protein